MENKKIPRCPNIVKYNRTMVERENIDTPNKQIHEGSLSCTVTSITSGEVKVVVWAQTYLSVK